jgi:hypothetical protein
MGRLAYPLWEGGGYVVMEATDHHQSKNGLSIPVLIASILRYAPNSLIPTQVESKRAEPSRQTNWLHQCIPHV